MISSIVYTKHEIALTDDSDDPIGIIQYRDRANAMLQKQLGDLGHGRTGAGSYDLICHNVFGLHYALPNTRPAYTTGLTGTKESGVGFTSVCSHASLLHAHRGYHFGLRRRS
ncbi:hypothetical protein VQ042_25505, partial [Aurantimonas sp. A2-1-M11]